LSQPIVSPAPPRTTTIRQFIALVQAEEARWPVLEQAQTATMISRLRKIFYGTTGGETKLIPGAASVASGFGAVTWTGDLGSVLAEAVIASITGGRSLTAPETQTIVNEYASPQDMLGNIDAYAMASARSRWRGWLPRAPTRAAWSSR